MEGGGSTESRHVCGPDRRYISLALLRQDVSAAGQHRNIGGSVCICRCWDGRARAAWGSSGGLTICGIQHQYSRVNRVKEHRPDGVSRGKCTWC